MIWDPFFSNTKWPVSVENFWCVFRVEPPISNTSGIVWTKPDAAVLTKCKSVLDNAEWYYGFWYFTLRFTLFQQAGSGTKINVFVVLPLILSRWNAGQPFSVGLKPQLAPVQKKTTNVSFRKANQSFRSRYSGCHAISRHVTSRTDNGLDILYRLLKNYKWLSVWLIESRKALTRVLQIYIKR